MYSSSILIQYGIGLLRIVLIASIGWWGSGYIGRALKRKLSYIYADKLVVELFTRLVSYLILFITIIALLCELNVNIAGLLGAAGVIGVAIGFAARTSVANIISGLFLMIERPFELGDHIKIDQVEGRVTAINLFAVTLYTDNNRAVRVPHEKLLKSTIINITGPALHRHDINIKVTYGQDINRVVQVIQAALKANQYALDTPVPMIRVQELTGDYYDILIGAWTLQQNNQQIKQTLLAELKNTLEKQSVVLYSAQHIWVRE